MANIVNGYDLDTQSGRADFRNAGGWVEGNSSGGGYSYQTASGATGSGGGTQTPTQGATYNTGGAQTTVQASNPSQTSVQQLGQQINSLLGAIASGNKQAFDEAVRQFDLSFGLDKDKFTEAIRQFNENLGIAQAGLTGQYQGQQTLQAQNQYFQQGLAGINAAAALQTNPFRQAQAMGQIGGLLRGQGVAGFQAPGQVTGQTDFSGLGNMQRLIDDIRGGPGAINSATANEVLNSIPTPAKLDSASFLRSSPGTQGMVLSGIQEKYGISPDEALAQIKNTLPQFQAPNTFGTVRS